MAIADEALYHAAILVARASATATATSTASATSTSAADGTKGRPPIYKVVGIILAVCSGLFIGVSFVIKKIGLLKANVKYHEEAGEGFGYLKNAWWWLGMTLMILGELCNFVAYAFTDAILVTPLGALSVVITTILSWIVLKERLSFVGWVACFLSIIGSIIITVNAPEQAAVANIQEMQHYVITPGFLTYAGIIIVGCLVVIFFVAPKYGRKSMLVYLTVCSLIGGLSVVATQGLGAAILAQINGEAQFNKWFTYVLLVFVICTLLTEIVYLNKALNLFNAALVTPTYYVYFTSSTIVASAVLFQGFHGTTTQILDVIMGFLTICSGVVLLQLAKSAKDVPDSKVFSGDLDQIRTVAEVSEPEYEPRADTLRGGAGIVRAISKVRTKRQAEEAVRIHDERMEPIQEGEEVQWDGLRRRKTVSSLGGGPGSVSRRKTVHPPLGMSHFPDEISEPDSEVHPGFFGRIGKRNHPSQTSQRSQRGVSPVPLETVGPNKQDSGAHVYGLPSGLQRPHDAEDTSYQGPRGRSDGHTHVQWAGDATDDADSRRRATSQTSSLAPPQPPPHGASRHPPNKRQFSFQNVFHRNRGDSDGAERPVSRGALSFASRHSDRDYPTGNSTTEEERLGLVHGDSHKILPKFDEDPDGDDEDEWQVTSGHSSSSPEILGASGGGGGGDLGRQRRMEGEDEYGSGSSGEEDLYHAPLRTPSDPTRDEDVREKRRGGGGSGRGGSGGAFV